MLPNRMSKMITEAILVRLWKAARRVLVLAAVASSPVVAHAQSFSADIVTRQDDISASAGRLSVLDGKVRIEAAERSDGFFLVDPAQPSAYFVRPGARLYMEARQSSRFTWLFIPVDPEAPCQQWQAMARLAGVTGPGEWRCERTGEETIDGYPAVVFRVLSADGQQMSCWIDRQRHFPLQVKTGDGLLFKLDRIKDGPQPRSSFELPANFHKFSPEVLIERIKQSDVWVAKPGGDKPDDDMPGEAASSRP